MPSKPKANLLQEKKIFFTLITAGFGGLILLILTGRFLDPNRFGIIAFIVSLATILLLLLFIFRLAFLKPLKLKGNLKKKKVVEKTPALFFDLAKTSLVLGAIAFLLSLGSLKFLLAKKFNLKKSLPDSFLSLWPILFFTLFLNSDFILAKYLLPAEEAGYYAVLSLLGKIIFFSAWVIAGLIFSLLKEAKPKNRPLILKRSLILTLLISLSLVILYYLFPELIIIISFGFDYLRITPFLGLFGLAMILLSLANLLIYYFLVLDPKKILWPLALAWFFQIIALSFWHQTVFQFTNVMLLIAVFLFLSLFFLFFLLKNKKAAKPVKS